LARGKHKEKRLNRNLIKNSMDTIESQEIMLTMVIIDSAKKLTKETMASVTPLIEVAMQSADDNKNSSFCVVLNKIDLVHPKSDLLGECSVLAV